MTSSHRKRTGVTLLVALALLAGGALLSVTAHGQDAGCPGGPRCIDYSTFDSDTDGWVAANADTTLTWLASKTLGTSSLATGVVQVYDPHISTSSAPWIKKTFYLQAGHYQLSVRAGEDLDIQQDIVTIYVRHDGTVSGWYGSLSPWYFLDIYSQVITVDQPGPVDVEIENSKNFYIDSIALESMDAGAPTLTPTTVIYTPNPSQPTPTASTTPIPYAQQATPMPVPTAVCSNAQPTPVGQYVTETVTTTTWSMLETFWGIDLYSDMGAWQRTGVIDWVAAPDHTGDASGAARLKYDNAPVTNAIILPVVFTGTYYLNAWAQADVVPVGATAYMEVWAMSGTWSRVAQIAIGAQHWYPLHVTITGDPTALAFVATRSDSPSSGFAYIDDIYLYAPESNMPYCSGAYPGTTTSMTGSGLYGGSDSVTLLYPGDKPCPGEVMQPNNIWGMILAQFTLFLDAQMAWSPVHVLGTTRDLAQQFMLGPIGGMVALATIIFDWRIPITMLEIYLAFQAGLGIIGIWKVIRRAFII